MRFNPHNIRTFFVVLVFCTFSLLAAQFPTPVKVVADVLDDDLRAGEVFTVKSTLTIDKNWHIYAVNKVVDGPIPSQVNVTGENVIDEVGVTVEPEPDTKFDEGFQIKVYYHRGTVTLETPVKLKSSLTPGNYSISVEVLYQACDPTICLPPTTDTVNIDITINPGEAREEKLEFVATLADISSDDGNIDLEAVKKEGLFPFLLLAITMGFLALLTPCVFPMIPITISYFTKQGEIEGRSPIKQASVYSIGIILAYTVLGLILAATLGASGANQLAASPWVNLFIGALFVYFALSLFGMYEIQLPAAIRQFTVRQEGKGGYAGTLFMALTFTVTSFTCTVQFVGLLLVAAVQGEWIWPGVGMLFFSGAFALPFFFLALFPQYLSRMPRSGGWLNSIKVVMGFLELAAAIKFFSNSDLVWSWGVFTRSSVLAIWVVIVFITGIYILGKIRLPHDSKVETIGVLRLIFSIFLFAFSVYMARGLVGQPVHGLLDTYLPPVLQGEANRISTVKSAEDHPDWTTDYNEGVREAKRTGKPILLNFTGITCTNCRWMESNIFKEPDVIQLFKSYVLIELFTDTGPDRVKNQKMEVERFGTAALPFYVILDQNEEVIATFPGLTRDLDKFLRFLQKGLRKKDYYSSKSQL